jgi:hypothetical protein
VPFLIFVDTNILLDFYRIRTREAGLSILRKLEQHRASLITTDQVVMEFMKNRQRVLLETHRNFKAPDWASLTLPPLLVEAKGSKTLEWHKKSLINQSAKLRDRLTKVLKEPSRYDRVYQTFQRILKHRGVYTLSREKSERIEVRESAEKRFKLGYPPRKDVDTSFGDAINWEWIIRCAKSSGHSVVLVSRDTDYGASVDGQLVLNDWLREEFRDRVAKNRQIVLTDRITEGLKKLAVAVTAQEEHATEHLAPSNLLTPDPVQGLPPGWVNFGFSAQTQSLPPGVRGLLFDEFPLNPKK